MKKQGIVVFSFGAGKEIKSNQVLARIANILAKSQNVVVFTQNDIPLKDSKSITKIDEIAEYPPTTLRMVRESIRWATKNQLEQLTIITAPPHRWRAVRDYSEVLSDLWPEVNIELTISNSVDNIDRLVWFCKDSSQIRTRHHRNWIVRELIFELMPYRLYVAISNFFDKKHYDNKPL